MKHSSKIMGELEEYPETVQFDRTVEQAILVIKKGAYLLKCGRRGKPKFCHFRLSMDEKYLVWFSGQEERQLKLSSVTKIVRGQRTVNFRRQPLSDREEQSFSLIYANTDQTLDLICTDKAQVESWVVGLRAVILKCCRLRTFSDFKSGRGVQSCVSSPAGFFRRKRNLGLLGDSAEFSQMRSLCASLSQLQQERCLSNGLSCPSSNFYSSESSLSRRSNELDVVVPSSQYRSENSDRWGSDSTGRFSKGSSQRFSHAHPRHSQQIQKDGALKDIMIWGAGVLGEAIGGVTDQSNNQIAAQNDALSPKLLESTVMLDVVDVSLGGKHAALVTRQGDVFCWGAGDGGKLGHRVNMDANYPKLVESLNGVSVRFVTCGEYQTCAISESGELYIWGDSGHHIGNSMSYVKSSLSDPFSSLSVLKVACGLRHVAIISTSGQLLTYGDGSFGVLGHGNTEAISKPKEVETFKGFRVKSVSCGPWHTAAVAAAVVDCRKYNDDSGKLFTWGDGDKGKLGHPDVERKLVPTLASKLKDHDFVQVSCGWTMTVALTKTGVVYTMGSSMHGQLGNPQAKDRTVTIVNESLKGHIVKEISSGSHHVAVLTSMGNVYTWGKGSNGQLGLGDTHDRNCPCFVEALGDRCIETVACGSNITAVVCLHVGVSPSDQSSCSRCKLPFGLTRKKHNCYNCGHLFCHACSSRKAANSSLAPNKTKHSRVCDPCFELLQRIPDSNKHLKLEENLSPRLVLTRLQRKDDDAKRDGLNRTPKIQNDENFSEKESTSVFNKRTRWGAVLSPVMFRLHRDGFDSFSSSASQLSSSSPSPLSLVAQGPECISKAVLSTEKSFSASNKLLTEEVEWLRTKVRGLEDQCERRGQKIQDCQRQLDETWLSAKDAAAKCKAAKDVIKALALRLHTMKDRVYTNKESNNGVVADNQSLPYLTRVVTHSDSEAKLVNERQGNGLCLSPSLFSDSPESLRTRNMSHEGNRLLEASPRQNRDRAPKAEWVEQYKPGVYITFTTLANGQKSLKRVRFSRKRFAEKEAQKWWEENQILVHEKYGMEGYKRPD